MRRADRQASPSQLRFARKPAMRRFLSNEKGSTAVEFAMIAVPFLGLLGAIFEAGMVYFNSAQLQTVTELASRSIQTNTATAGNDLPTVHRQQRMQLAKERRRQRRHSVQGVRLFKNHSLNHLSYRLGLAGVGGSFYLTPPSRNSVITLPASAADRRRSNRLPYDARGGDFSLEGRSPVRQLRGTPRAR